MISSLLFSMSALCFVAMFLPQRPSRPRQSLETYFVCDPESYPSSEKEVALPALAGGTHG
jgi:hypothetical protein